MAETNMANLRSVVTRSFKRKSVRPICVGILIVLIIVSWKLFSAQPDANVYGPSGIRSKSSESSNFAPVTSRKRLVNIPFDNDNSEPENEDRTLENEISEDEDSNGNVAQKHDSKGQDLHDNIAEMERPDGTIKQEPEIKEKSTTLAPKGLEDLEARPNESQRDSSPSQDFRLGRYNILMTLVKATRGSFLAKSLGKCVKSICKHSSIDLMFHFIVDQQGSQVVGEIFSHMSGKCKASDVMYHDVQKLTEKLTPSITSVLQKHFSAGSGSYYSGAIFFLSTALHQLFPEKLTQVIMLDLDLRFASDIKLLFNHFEKFQSTTIMGLVGEQSPVYRHTFESYRKANPGTRVGEPPPKGITGYNSGVVLASLENMRKSRVYNQILTDEAVNEIVKKYQFKGHLGDQDFFTVLSIDHPELFYTLPCTWNRQLCMYWRDNGYAAVFDLYYNCSKPIHVYHGNCRAKIPIDSDDSNEL